MASPDPPAGPRLVPVRALVLALFAAAVVRTAWLGDDSYITFRTVDHFVHGRGLVWNVGERVQAYTHPLWMFLVSAFYAVTNEIYFTVLSLQLVLSLGAAALLVGFARTRWAVAVAGFGLLSSRALIEYSTSGLENALTHVLVLLFAYELSTEAPRTRRLGVWFGLLCLNRLDLCLFGLPALAWLAYRDGLLRTGAALAPGLLPVLLWECFSFFYYGFLAPNTLPAKLGAAIPAGELMLQGFTYLMNALVRDPITPTFIAAAAAVSLGAPRRDPAGAALGAGMLLYVLYVIRIGGDFMTGRFFTPPAILALALLARTLTSPKDAKFALILLVAARFAPTPNFLGGVDYSTANVDNKGISDEARFYGPEGALATANRQQLALGVVPGHTWAWDGRSHKWLPGVEIRHAVGYFSFFAGPQVHVIDQLALGDPLLARLPASFNHDWRVGHYERIVPEGYLETLQTGTDRFLDRQLAQYYEKLHRVIAGPLFDLDRLRLAVELNLGWYDHLIDFEHYRYPGVRLVGEDRVRERRPAGFPWDDPHNIVLTPTGAKVLLKRTSHATGLDLSLDNNDVYELRFLKDHREVARMEVGPKAFGDGLATFELTVPPRASEDGYDTVWVLPMGFDGKYSLGHLMIR